MVHRKLNRSAEHRASLLRNLVTNVLEHESITTTHAKAKEAQTAIERVITAAKHLHASRGSMLREDINRRTQLLQNKFYKADELFPKLMNDSRTRYENFNGGYTRILKLEPRVGDMSPQSILELIGGKRDMRFASTAKAVARSAALGEKLHPVTIQNMKKITKTQEMKELFETEVEKMKSEYFSDVNQGETSIHDIVNLKKQRAPIEVRSNPLTKHQQS